MPLAITNDAPLAPLTTLELGGPAQHLAIAEDETTMAEALRWAAARHLPVLVLGGGSNLVIADAGFAGLVIRVASRGVWFEDDGDTQLVRVAAGEPWDGVVAQAVARDLAGIECLSGIPGLTGATPIQNVGAYGQEVAESIRSVRVLDRATLAASEMAPERCGFGYRDSVFKHEPDRWIVVEVTFALRRGGAPTIRYRELEQMLAHVAPGRATLADLRDAVLALRRGKSMVVEPGDVNRRSVGSFFMNPVVSSAEADRLAAQWVADRRVAPGESVPRFPAGGGGDRVKLSAAWLIERAGLSKGYRQGAMGISSRHALALVHHGGGTTAELLALADVVRDTVERRLGVRLVREPVVR